MDATQDGGVAIVAGFFPDLIQLVRLDASGNLKWQKGFWDDSGGWRYGASAVTGTVDGGMVVAGTAVNVLDEGDCWIWKLDQQGNTEWAWVYATWENADCESVMQTDDGGYVVAALATEQITGEDYLWVLRLDAGGSLLWYRLFSGTGAMFSASVCEADGGDLLASSGAVVLRLDPKGASSNN